MDTVASANSLAASFWNHKGKSGCRRRCDCSRFGWATNGVAERQCTKFDRTIFAKAERQGLDIALDAAMDHVASKGVTEVHTMITVDCANGLWPQNMGRDAESQNVDAAFEELEVYRRS